METLVKMEGIPEDVLKVLIAKGYFKTKTEAMRAGILELGKSYQVLKSPEELEMELVSLRIKKQDEEISKKKQKYFSENEVKKKYGF